MATSRLGSWWACTDRLIRGQFDETGAAVNAEIRSIARIAGLDQSWVDAQIDAEADADTARRAAFEALAHRSSPAIRTEQVRVEIGESQDEPASVSYTHLTLPTIYSV